MEAAATLFLDTDNHVKSDIDWNICIIWQERKFPKQKFPLSKGTNAGISRVLHCAGIREHVQDDTYKRCSEIVNCLEKKGNQDAFWHRQCYTDFTTRDIFSVFRRAYLLAKNRTKRSWRAPF